MGEWVRKSIKISIIKFRSDFLRKNLINSQHITQIGYETVSHACI
jgi:hypothetical protein